MYPRADQSAPAVAAHDSVGFQVPQPKADESEAEQACCSAQRHRQDLQRRLTSKKFLDLQYRAGTVISVVIWHGY